MKKVLVLTMVLVSFVSYGQSDGEILSKSSKWFKDVYVQSSFKDPYSYKELKITLDTMSNYSWYTRKTDDYMLNSYKKSYDEYTAKVEVEKNKRRPSYPGALEQYEKWAAERKVKYDNEVLKVNDAKEKIATMSETERKLIHHYIIHIDSHGANSYGGIVFGRYVFTYTKGKEFDVNDVLKVND